MESDKRYRRFIEDCCAALEVEPSDVLGACRESGPVMQARHALGWLLRERFGLSYPHMGRVLGRDHTTVMASVKKFALALSAGEGWAREIASRAGMVDRKVEGIEGPLESLRYCREVAIELELGAAGA